MQHLDEGTIHAWLDGALPPEQAADVERHARSCAECSALVADARGVIAGAARIVSALDNVPAGVIPARQAQTSTRSLWRTLRFTPFRAAIAASLMLTVASMLVVRHAPENQATDNVAAVPAPAAAPTVISAARDSNAKVLKDAQPTTPPRSRTEVVAKTAPTAPAAAPPPVIARGKALAQVKEPAPAAAVDSIGVSAAEAKLRSANVRQLSEQTAQAPVNAAASASGARAADATERDAARRESVVGQTISVVAMSSDERPIETPGCYQIVRDSVGVPARIPDRFSLDIADESGARRNIVRAVNQAGRRDSVLPGITWRLVPGSTRLVFISNESPLPLTMFRPRATSEAARAAPGRGGAGNIEPSGALPRISRVDCR